MFCKDARHVFGVTVGSLVLLTGCGSNDGVYPVNGRVTWTDGTAAVELAESTVELQSADDAPKRFSPRGEVQADGTFQLRTHKPNDGAPAGNYRVIVMPKLTMDDEARPTKLPLPNKYQQFKTTPLTVEVKPDSNEVTFTVERNK